MHHNSRTFDSISGAYKYAGVILDQWGAYNMPLLRKFIFCVSNRLRATIRYLWFSGKFSRFTYV